jgi:hypothetical protein
MVPVTPPDKPKFEFPTEEFDEYLLLDDNDWRTLEPAFTGQGGEARADAFANMLAILIRAIESGPAGTARAVHTLKDGVRFAYKYTPAHKLALQFYYICLSRDTLVKEEPEQLLVAALLRVGVVLQDDNDE